MDKEHVDVSTNNETNTGSEEREEQNTEQEKKPQKFVFNCIKSCGQCCERWEEIPVYIEDLQRWLTDGSLNAVLPFLQIKELSQFAVQMILKRPSKGDEEDSNPSGCPLYDHENKICNLYYSMPLHCSAYPLGFNGQKFFLVDKDCPGLGNGKMTKEWLTACKTRAQDHFNAQGSSAGLMSILYGLILGHIMKKSQEAMEQLSEEDRKKLDELLTKSKEEETDSDSTEEEKE